MIETKKRSLILTIVLEAIILIIAFLFWPNSNKIKQSNKIDRTKTQIKIIAKRLNIREDASEDSADIGDVYKDEIYNVVSHVDKEDYYWYHIITENGIDGYIASDPKNEYVSLISGYIDRNPPTIYFQDDFIEVLDDDYLFDSVHCEDDYTNCGLSYDLTSPEVATFRAVDDDGNVAVMDIKYFKVYSLYSEYYDNRRDINAKFTKKKNNNEFVITANYSINSEIASENKSVNYVPFVDFFDENFNRLDDVFVSFNYENIPDSCMNDSSYKLKEDYLETNLLKGNSICMSYSFDNSLSLIKYIAVGFSGVENYDNPLNILSGYYSKYFLIAL